MPFISVATVMDSGWGKGWAPPRRSFFLDLTARELWMWTMAKEKSVGWELWESMEASQREQWVHVCCRGWIWEECHTGKVCFRCACAPHYQRNNVVKLPTALCRCAGASSQDLARTALWGCALTSFIKLSPGPYFPCCPPLKYLFKMQYFFKMQNTLNGPTRSEF